MLSKRQLEATKIYAPVYKSTGSCSPRQGDSPAEVVQNIAYVKSEIVRWYESLAWVSDQADFRETAGLFDLICDTLLAMGIDDCYRAVNGVIALIPETLRPWECSIIRDLETNNAMRVDLYYGVVNVVERLLPSCKGNVRFLRLFMRHIYTSKQSLFGLAKTAGADIPWTYENLTGNPDVI